MSCYETFKTAIARGKRTISDETRNLFLVVTVLIITTTYNASLAPPKVKLSDTVRADRQSEALAIPDYPTPTKNQWFPDSIDAIADVFSMYWLYNSLIFWASVGLTAFLLPSRSSVCFFLHIALSFLGTCYMLLMAATSFDVIYYFQSKSDSNDWYYVNFIMNYLFALFLSLFVAYRIALYVRLKLAMTSRRVYLILIAPLSVVVLAPIIPAVVLAEKLWRRDVKGHV
ncbi:ankyrin repeat-containing protein [Corchorus olitorius]|uniref:Ankyrin repeat-containing protein n=1 Tax=Corchorus olitorius TaxID=93759 RepID=A0A1R3JQG4_9ROSI|nr:ankyrin repeat-containing protein [Corchorus olitorius]